MNIFSQNPPKQNLESLLHTLDILLCPPAEEGLKRRKIRKSRFKALYAIHIMRKHNRNRGRTEDFFGEELLAEIAHIHVSSFKAFIRSPDFALFGEVNRSPWRSNSYRLYDELYEIFDLFERVGMMRGFHADFDKWRGTFLKRLRKVVIPLAAENSIEQIRSKMLTRKRVINRLSTESHSKMSTEPPLKSPIRPLCGAPPILDLNQTDFVGAISKEMGKIEQLMSVEFCLQGSDLYSILTQNSLKDIKAGLRLREEYRVRGIECRSQVALMQHCITKSRKMSKERASK